MADNSQVIQEFLTSLGFKVDENEFKKFVGGLAVAEKGAMSTGKAVLGIAVAAEAMVVSFASSMEKLYYASQRTGASVENLQSLEFGSRKIGLAAGQAREALEGMAAATRMNPGLRGLIDGLLGKDTASLDQAQVMIDLVQKLSTMPHYQGAQFASLFGMDEKTFLMLKQGLPELIKAEQERRDMNRQANIDAQAAAAAGKEYANSITDITTRLGVLRDRLSLEMLPSFREFNKEVITVLDNLAKFKLSDHPRTKESLQTTRDTMGDTARSVSGYTDFFGGLVTFDKKQIKRGLRTMWNNLPGSGAMRNAEQRSIDRRTTIGKIGHPTTAGELADSAPANLPGGMRRHNPGNIRKGANDLQTSVAPPSIRAIPRNNPGNIRKGANDFQTYATPQAGLSAMAGNLLAYHDKHGLNNLRDIIERWAPHTENNTGAYIDDVAKRLDVKSDAALDLKDPAVLSKLMGAMIHHEQGYSPFGAADLLTTAKDRINGGNAASVVLNQKTDIHVASGDSAAATGRAVALEQSNVNSTLVRNFQGAVQ